jgi:protein-tyrosine-phosphatase/DNA-binding HxlR family transcriptional regulator
MNDEQIPGLERRAMVHAALGDVTRLRIVDLLQASDLSSAQLGAALDVPSNLLAHHLGVLEDAGLVHRHRSEGDRRRTYLSLEPRALPVLPAATAGPAPLTTRRVLFVCTANTARSHLAAALWRRTSPVAVTSAGTHPGDRIHRGAIAAARRHHLDLPDIRPRLLADTLREGDLVITVCDRAHEEIGDLASAHWSIRDPVPDGTKAAFEAAHDALRTRVDDLAIRVSTPA